MNCRTSTMLNKQQWSGWRNKMVFKISDFLLCFQCSNCWKGKGNYIECSVRSERDSQLCYLNTKDIGGCLVWIQWGRRRLQSSSCHCSLFKIVLIRRMEKVSLPAWFASVSTTQWSDHGWLFFPEFAVNLINKHKSSLWKLCLYVAYFNNNNNNNLIF